MGTPEGLWPVEELLLCQEHKRSGGNPVRNMEQQKETFVHMIEVCRVACCFTKGVGTEYNPQ